MSAKPFSARYQILAFIAFVGLSCELVEADDPIPPHETFTIESKAVAETRVICVWVPKEYDPSKQGLPVLYMPDGGVGEDFPHIANTVSDLIDQGVIEPAILVGIENTERRRDLTGPSEVQEEAQIAPITDGASKFRQFISDELFPEIDKRYNTTKRRGIIGESAAGLFVVETLLLKPEMFDVYIAMDPAIYWNDQYLVRQASNLLKNLGDKPKRLWFATSATIDIAPPSREFAEALRRHAPPTLVWDFSDEPKQRHNTIFRATKVKAMTWALSGKPFRDR